jgi:hypothetical protein
VLELHEKMVFILDQETVKFIKGFIVPLVRAVADGQGPGQKEFLCSGESQARSQDSSAGFHFMAPQCPNIRDKVSWNVRAHAWTILCKKPTHGDGLLTGSAPVCEDFPVEPHVSAHEYEEQKVAAYSKAMEAWNLRDGSNRHRIPIAILAGSQPSDGAGNSDGK